ncbi:MAG TPA: hypothetical protein VHB79_31745 [Polyangiaceae bacterium]|nr:hypothetical protein [Polyangiaceae bacterium]
MLVLEAPTDGWKEGVQALVAELLTSGYELTVRGGHARSPDQLEDELQREAAEAGAVAGVTVTRTDNRASAWLCRGVNPCEQLEIEIADDELSRSRLALAVLERLRPIELPLTVPTPKAAPRPAPSSANARLAVEPPRPPSARLFRVWVGGGGVLSSGIAGPLPWVGASLGATLNAPWGLEVGLAGSPLPGSAHSYAGSLSLRALQGIGFATFEPFPRRKLGLSLGLGGGAVHVRESATPAPGFDAFSRSATVAVVSARARLQYRAGPVYLGLAIDPGMLVPALKVEAGAATVLRIGRPWVALQGSLGLVL